MIDTDHLYVTGRLPFRDSPVSGRLPRTAVYFRILLAASSDLHARQILIDNNLGEYADALRRPTSGDGPAVALARYLQEWDQVDAGPFVVYRTDTDLLWRPETPALWVAGYCRGADIDVYGRVMRSNGSFIIEPQNEIDDPEPVADTVNETTSLFPEGQVGRRALALQARLLDHLAAAERTLQEVASRIRRTAKTDDPASSVTRYPSDLLSLSVTFASLACDASAIELALADAKGADY